MVFLFPFGCSEDPDVKGTETCTRVAIMDSFLSCSEDPDVKGTETMISQRRLMVVLRCSEDPDVKGTETHYILKLHLLD